MQVARVEAERIAAAGASERAPWRLSIQSPASAQSFSASEDGA